MRAGTCSEVQRVESAAVNEDHNGGRSRLEDRLDQFLLRAGQIQACHIMAFSVGGTAMLALTDDHNGNLGLFGGPHGLGKSGLVRAHNLAAADVGNFGLG